MLRHQVIKNPSKYIFDNNFEICIKNYHLVHNIFVTEPNFDFAHILTQHVLILEIAPFIKKLEWWWVNEVIG